MKMKSVFAASIIVVFGAALGAQALTITLPGVSGYQRKATLSDASQGFFGTGNGTVDKVEGYLGGDWTERGSVEPADGSGVGTYANGLLSINVLSGSFGSTPVSGTWTITDSSFWSTYGDAAISMHAGNGGGDPDHFVWLITDGTMSGTWSYERVTGTGGGLSNLKLYTRGEGHRTPDGGATLALIGLAMTGLSLAYRKNGKL